MHSIPHKILLAVCFSVFTAASSWLHAEAHPLTFTPAADTASRAYWLPSEVDSKQINADFQAVVSAPAQLTRGLRKIKIAFIYPSADVSDFNRRNFKATTERLKALGIDFETVEFKSRQIEHSLQSAYVQEVLAHKDEYDYVIFTPSELSIQAENIAKLTAQGSFKTFIWAFHTPLKSLEKQPLMWLDFSSSEGAKVLCDYMIERLGENVSFAMNRGIPGVTDDQRSGDFKRCVENKANWESVYEHYGQYRPLGGADGARLINKYYPEAKYLHNANTAMTKGSIDALSEIPPEQRMLVSGWGGTGFELNEIRQRRINATPMRISDDLGVATAEAIRHCLQKNVAKLPLIYLGRISIAHDQMTAAELDLLEQQAFRYSGELATITDKDM